VNRVTLLVTATAALFMIPVVAIGIPIVLPAFGESVLPFCLILPGIVSLSVSKVLSGYVSGVGDPGSVARVSVASLGVNVAANIVLIPRLGIAGAALASTISYTFHACLMTVLTSEMAGVTLRALLVPTMDDVRTVIRAGGSIAARRFPA
jgi:Na+-driven multidrug efflux pump